jgi:hypothetical protein
VVEAWIRLVLVVGDPGGRAQSGRCPGGVVVRVGKKKS